MDEDIVQMRILHIGKYWDEIGGIETYVRELAESQAKKHKIDVLVSNTKNSEEIIEKKNLKVIKARRFFSLNSAPFADYYRHLKSKNYDIIHFHHPNPIATIAYLLAKPKGKLILTYHADIVKQNISNFFFAPFPKKLLKRAEKIIVTSQDYLDTSKVLHDFRSKCTVIPLGIDINKIKSKEIKHKTPTILFVGRLVKWKGVDYLIKAMKGVDAKIIIAGDGTKKEKLQNLAEKLDVNAEFLGKIKDREKLEYYYNLCDIFVLPSIARNESFGIVLLEAMAHGKPVISTEIGTGTSFANKNNETGIVVKPKDEKELRAAINILLKNRKLRVILGKNARKRVEQHFSLKKMLSATENLYKNL